jgi:hypothetical protein
VPFEHRDHYSYQLLPQKAFTSNHKQLHKQSRLHVYPISGCTALGSSSTFFNTLHNSFYNGLDSGVSMVERLSTIACGDLKKLWRIG